MNTRNRPFPQVTQASVYHRHPNDTCHSIAPEKVLVEPYRLLFTILIFSTALVALVLNLFVIITLVMNSVRNRPRPKGSSGGGGSSSNGTGNINGGGGQQHHQRQYRSSGSVYSNTHKSFISLSVSVMLYSSISVPAMFLVTIDHHQLHFAVRLIKILFYVSPIASSFMHLLMAIDRYLAIKQIYNFSQYWYRRHYTFCIVLVWVLSFLVIFPFFFKSNYSTQVLIMLRFFRLMVAFTIPSLLTLILYLKIACELSKIKNDEAMAFIQDNPMITNHKKVIIKILLLAFTHFLSWFPFSVVESLNDLFPDLFHRCSSDEHAYLYYRLISVLILITSMSGILYPILYAFISSSFYKILYNTWRNKGSFSAYSDEGNTSMTTMLEKSSVRSSTKHSTAFPVAETTKL